MKKEKKTLLSRAMPFIMGGSLIRQIVVALVLGTLTAYFMPGLAADAGFLGTLFVSALKAVAPVLVLALVSAAIANQDVDVETHVKPILVLYCVGTFCAAVTAVLASFAFPVTIQLAVEGAEAAAPEGVGSVLKTLFLSAVDNPVHALLTGNYIGILTWGAGLGIALKKASNRTREILNDLAGGVEFIVHVVIRCAPIGIFGLVANTLATEGFSVLVGYAQLLGLLLGCMAFVALVLNPLIVWYCTKENPYPLTFTVLKESGVMAFFTRSSAANIPVNMNLCRKLNLPEDTFGVSIPLGSTINMAGAAVTITVLTLSACHTLGIEVHFITAVLLSLLASVCACGTAGVPGGSLMLIPLACSLFGIDSAVSMQVVAVGFIISVLQDSCETGLNSSSDVLFTAAACKRGKRLEAEAEAKYRRFNDD